MNQFKDVPCRVNVEHGVALIGEMGETVGHRTLVYVSSSLTPRNGDALVLGNTVDGTFVPSKAYTLDSLESDDGYTARFFVT